MPLDIMGFGYYAIIKAGGMEGEKSRTFVSNAISLAFILALQLRQIPNAVIAVVSISILLSIVVIIVGNVRKSD
jgi:hypothetical protein